MAEHKAQRLDKVWVEGKKPQPNGYILFVDYKEKEITVKFYDTVGTETYTFEQFYGHWTEKFGGTYMLEGGQ